MIKYTREKTLGVKKHLISEAKAPKKEKRKFESIATIKRIARRYAGDVDCDLALDCLEALPGYVPGAQLTNVAGNVEWSASGASAPAILMEAGASSKISAMTDGGPLIAGDELVINRGGANFKIQYTPAVANGTLQDFNNYLGATFKLDTDLAAKFPAPAASVTHFFVIIETTVNDVNIVSETVAPAWIKDGDTVTFQKYNPFGFNMTHTNFPGNQPIVANVQDDTITLMRSASAGKRKLFM